MLRSSADGMNHTHVLTLEGWKAELALGGWLVTYRNKCPKLGTELGHYWPSQY